MIGTRWPDQPSDGDRTATGDFTEIELEVTAIVDSERREAHVRAVTKRVVKGLGDSDVFLFTTRALLRDPDPSASLEIAQKVSTALIDVVRGAVAAQPAWAYVIDLFRGRTAL